MVDPSEAFIDILKMYEPEFFDLFNQRYQLGFGFRSILRPLKIFQSQLAQCFELAYLLDFVDRRGGKSPYDQTERPDVRWDTRFVIAQSGHHLMFVGTEDV